MTFPFSIVYVVPTPDPRPVVPLNDRDAAVAAMRKAMEARR